MPALSGRESAEVLRVLQREHIATEADLAARRERSRRLASRLVHEPIGKPGGPGVWGMKGAEYPAFFQHIRNDLMQAGHPEAEAHSLAWGILRNFAAGHDGKGHKVSAETQAKAVAAMAEMKALQARAKATRSERMEYDGDGLDQSWDGDHSDLPDLTGLGTPEFEAAEQDLGWPSEPGAAARAAKLGTGTRFARLKSSLAAKGASNPGALAAWIGRRKYGKARFHQLAKTARKPKAAVSRSAADWFRPTVPLEDIHVVTRSEGDGTGRVVEAYATVFEEPSEIHDHQGDYEELIDRAAFNRTIDHARPERNGGRWRVQCLYNHGLTVHGTPAERFSLPIGRPVDIRAEARGLLTRTEYANTPLGEEILELVRAGMILSQSFTGRLIRSSPDLPPGGRYRASAGRLIRVRRLELGLREYGPTPFPAYAGAEVVGVRMAALGTYAGYDPDDDDYGDPGAATDQEAPPPDGAPAAGDPPEGHSSRSVGNRIWQLRYEEQCAKAGITLPGGTTK